MTVIDEGVGGEGDRDRADSRSPLRSTGRS
jgi:hypothetical protein